MICKAEHTDIHIAAELAAKRWPGNEVSAFVSEFSRLIAESETAIFLAYKDGLPIGFAQCQLRHDYVEGTCSSPVGYLEGIFVEESWRHNGYATRLLSACEGWAKSMGCTEFASDCSFENTDGFQFHLRSGFQEANRIICFTKNL